MHLTANSYALISEMCLMRKNTVFLCLVKVIAKYTQALAKLSVTNVYVSTNFQIT